MGHGHGPVLSKRKAQSRAVARVLGSRAGLRGPTGTLAAGVPRPAEQEGRGAAGFREARGFLPVSRHLLHLSFHGIPKSRPGRCLQGRSAGTRGFEAGSSREQR